MSVPQWQAGKLYQPGSLVRRVNTGAVTQPTIPNLDFESGDTEWTKGTGWAINTDDPFAGSYSAERTGGTAAYIISDTFFDVTPGQGLSASAMIKSAAGATGLVAIRWYTSGDAFISAKFGDFVTGSGLVWNKSEVTGQAPATAAKAKVSVYASGTGTVYADNVTLSVAALSVDNNFVFEATQDEAGFSGSSEPDWPTSAGGTVVDNEVTWTAITSNRVVWEAKSILTSGGSEPTWPEGNGASVADNNILWTAEDRRVKDENCPNTKQVAIAEGKVFAADDDVVAFSATVNPLDWTTVNDAGFIPFGLNTYGAEPVSALGLYRSNLVIWNDQAFQMWQIDPDPQNFAILDAVPVGNRYYRSGSPVSNDLVWATNEGIRNMGIAGASTNLQAGFFGKQIDPLVKAALDAVADDDSIFAFFYPGAGQYWLVIEDTAFVLTMNGGKSDMSWSRYTFPSDIDEYTLKDGDLYLRSGNKVWLFDEDAVQDDEGGSPSDFEGRVWWHYLDFGALGVTKSLIGFDVVAIGTFDVAVGYDQSNTATATTDYELTGDTLPNDVIPLPVTAPSFQFRLTWAGGEAWEWHASALYLQDWRTTS